MKILLVNNFYYDRGGDCTYLLSLKRLLEEKGHKVIVFAMHHPQNFDSENSRYFVSYINYDEEVKDINLASGYKVLKRAIYSTESREMMDKLIEHEKPDIAHIQNVHHHITPSIFYSLKKNKIPIIWTLHDYTIICPNTSFLSHGKICERCRKNKFFWPSLEKCKKNSFSASTMAGLEAVVHRLTRFQNGVSYFIAPSEFLYRKFIEYGFGVDKLILLHSFTDYPLQHENEDSDNYYLFVGRIAEEKGVKTLIDAAVNINSCKLKIVGGGPDMDAMIAYAKSKDKNNMIEFLGHKGRDELKEIYQRCKFIVVPSEWYETTGLIIFEAFAYGKPAVASGIGGISEFVKDMERGLIFKTRNSEDLRASIQYLLDNPDLIAEMGANAREFIENELSAERHYEKLMKLYEKALTGVKNIAPVS